MPRKKLKSSAGDTAGVLVTSQTLPAESAPVVEVAAVSVVAVEMEPAPTAPQPEPVVTPPEEQPVPEGWAAHRRLIRATLPRTEGGEPTTPRPIPEFTMHQRQSRGFQGRGFRHGHGNGHHHNPFGNGNRGNHGGNGSQFRDGDGPDGNRAQPPGGGPGKPGRRRRRRRR